MLRGDRLPYCGRCYQEEERGLVSRRQRSIENNLRQRGPEAFQDWLGRLQSEGGQTQERPSHVEVRLGSKCNLRCRICAPEFSQLIRKAMEQLTQQGSMLPEFYRENLKLSQSRDDQSWQVDYVEKILANSSSINSMYFAGGEPLITAAYQRLVDEVIKSGDAGHISLTVNTNGTIATPYWLEAFEAFESVELYVSLDGIGPSVEYQRAGLSWPVVADNIQKFLNIDQNIRVKIFPTLSILNIAEIGSLLSWYGELQGKHRPDSLTLQVNVLHTPRFLQAVLLPHEHVSEIRSQVDEIARSFPTFQTDDGLSAINKIQTVLNQCGQKEFTKEIKELLAYTELMDSHYDQKLADHCPATGRVFRTLNNSIGCCE